MAQTFSKSSFKSIAYAARLMRGHHAHLRAVAEGISPVDSAVRYLGADPDSKAEAMLAHSATVIRAQAIARAAHKKFVGLIGQYCPPVQTSTAEPPMTLGEFQVDRNMEDWSEEEVFIKYEEYLAEIGTPPPSPKSRYRSRAKERQAALLAELQHLENVQPSLADPLNLWLAAPIAKRLTDRGVATLGSLLTLMGENRQWWKDAPGVGRAYACRIEAFLRVMVPPIWMPPPRPLRSFAAQPLTAQAIQPAEIRELVKEAQELDAAEPDSEIGQSLLVMGGTSPSSADPAPSNLVAAEVVWESTGKPIDQTYLETERDFVLAWIKARAAGSEHTALAYHREVMRLSLWASLARKRTLQQLNFMDLSAYRDFLANIPAAFIARERAKPFTPGWAPFSGPLQPASRDQALTIIDAFYAFAAKSNWVTSNPCNLIGKTTARRDDSLDDVKSKALTTDQVAALEQALRSLPAHPGRDRALFLLTFLVPTGLRVSEVTGARLKDISYARGLWFLEILGKGKARRRVALPASARASLNRYLESMGLPSLVRAREAHPERPLIVRVHDKEASTATVTTRMVQVTLKQWISRALAVVELPAEEQDRLRRATPHWLRHTCGTMLADAAVDERHIQVQFGHRDPRTTRRYTKSAIEEAATSIEQVFSDSP